MPITKQYIQSLSQLKAQFNLPKEPRILTLHSFWTAEEYQNIQTNLKKLHFSHHAIPTRYSCSTAQLNPELFSTVLSPELRSFLGKILNSQNLKIQLQAYSFKWKDYTLLHDIEPQHSSIEFFIDITEKWNTAWGGNSIFVDGSGDYYPLPLKGNTFTLLHRKKNWRIFVQYVNHCAQKNERIFLGGKIQAKNL